MLALSIWQPWASLIADKHKRFETRSWETRYRGPLLICAAQKRLPYEKRLAIYKDGVPTHLAHYFLPVTRIMGPNVPVGWNALPFGMAVCIAELTKIYTAVPAILASWPDNWHEGMSDEQIAQERALGDFSGLNLAWKLENVRRFKEPWPVTGRQRLFEVSDDEIEKHGLEAA